MKLKSKDIAVCAVAVALMFGLAWMPVAAFLIPVLFVACLYEPKQGLVVGIFAGLVCLSYAVIIMAMAKTLPGAVEFLILCAVMVIPRALVGLAASLACNSIRKSKLGGKLMRYLPYVAACCAGVMTNTVLVISSFYVLYPNMVIMGLSIGEYWWAFLLIGVAEMLVASFIIPPLCLSVGKALRLGEFAPKPVAYDESESSVGNSDSDSALRA